MCWNLNPIGQHSKTCAKVILSPGALPESALLGQALRYQSTAGPPLASSSLCCAWSPWRPLTCIYSLNIFLFFFFLKRKAGDHIFAKPGRDDLIHAATYAIALADSVLLYILQPYHAQLYRKVPVLYRSSLCISLCLFGPGSLYAPISSSSPRPAPGAIWTPPHTGPPQLHRTALGLQTTDL